MVIMAKTGAERQKAYIERLKASGRYGALQERDRINKQQLRQKKMRTSRGKSELRSVNRAYKRSQRQRQNQEPANSNTMVSS